MKLIFVSSEQFKVLWSRLQPMQRMTPNIPTPAIVLPHIDTTIMRRDSVTIGTIEGLEMPELPTFSWFEEVIEGNKFRLLKASGDSQ